MAKKNKDKKAKSKDKAGSEVPRGELLDMDQAIEVLKTSRPTFYRWLREGKIKGHKVGRQWRFYPEDIERFLKGKDPRIEVRGDFSRLIENLTDALAQAGQSDVEPDRPDLSDDPPRRAAELALRLGVQLRASDVHIHGVGDTQYPEGALLYRVDGVLHEQARFDAGVQDGLICRLKTMAGCDVAERALPQDGRLVLEAGDQSVDVRACFVPAVTGQAVTLRLLSKQGILMGLDNLPYSPADMDRIRSAIHSPAGLVVCAGPSGSGKTTLLYSCLDEVNTPGRKCLTVEDPVEFQFAGVVQMATRAKDGFGFAQAIRAIMRSDPDVILVGEVRNAETANACVQAALTGHLVLTSLHADSAGAALCRLVEIGVPGFVVGDATRLIVAQRLIRKLCPDCARSGEPSAEHMERAIAAAAEGGLDWDALAKNFRRPAGCAKCGQTGYRGRTCIAETLAIGPAIRRALRNGCDADALQRAAVAEGMVTMAGDGIARAASGQTTLEEIFRVLAL